MARVNPNHQFYAKLYIEDGCVPRSAFSARFEGVTGDNYSYVPLVAHHHP